MSKCDVTTDGVMLYSRFKVSNTHIFLSAVERTHQEQLKSENRLSISKNALRYDISNFQKYLAKNWSPPRVILPNLSCLFGANYIGMLQTGCPR